MTDEYLDEWRRVKSFYSLLMDLDEYKLVPGFCNLTEEQLLCCCNFIPRPLACCISLVKVLVVAFSVLEFGMLWCLTGRALVGCNFCH